jgi:hypothetical protein
VLHSAAPVAGSNDSIDSPTCRSGCGGSAVVVTGSAPSVIRTTSVPSGAVTDAFPVPPCRTASATHRSGSPSACRASASPVSDATAMLPTVRMPCCRRPTRPSALVV